MTVSSLEEGSLIAIGGVFSPLKIVLRSVWDELSM